MTRNTPPTDSLNMEFKELRQQLEKINTHWIFSAHTNLKKVIFYQFLRGLAFGFGSVVGATIVVSIVGYVLAQLEVVPIIGQWATDIGREIVKSGGQ